jgi:hypothetical protein
MPCEGISSADLFLLDLLSKDTRAFRNSQQTLLREHSSLLRIPNTREDFQDI